jgi:hypothetical protein
MRELKEMGYALVVVTNQSGIARGKFTEAQFETLTEWMDWSLADRGVDLDGNNLPTKVSGYYRRKADPSRQIVSRQRVAALIMSRLS